jgi:hypothetical protein
LEARWAVFFDALGIEWEYEPQGYDLGELGWYLPDFVIHPFGSSVSTYMEIKPDKDVSEKDAKKFLAFAEGIIESDATGVVLICAGDPMADQISMFGKLDGIKRSSFYGVDHKTFIPVWVLISKGIAAVQAMDHESKIKHASTVIQAMKKARQARFEHGECPA